MSPVTITISCTLSATYMHLTVNATSENMEMTIDFTASIVDTTQTITMTLSGHVDGWNFEEPLTKHMFTPQDSWEMKEELRKNNVDLTLRVPAGIEIPEPPAGAQVEETAEETVYTWRGDEAATALATYATGHTPVPPEKPAEMPWLYIALGVAIVVIVVAIAVAVSKR